MKGCAARQGAEIWRAAVLGGEKIFSLSQVDNKKNIVIQSAPQEKIKTI